MTADKTREASAAARITGWFALGAAVIAAVASIFVAVINRPARSTPVSTPSPAQAATTTTPPPSTTFPAYAEGVVCEPSAGRPVELIGVRAADGGSTLNGSMLVDVRVQQPPAAGGRYWLMVLLPDDPRPINIARTPLTAGQAAFSLPVQVASPAGSTRSFYVAESTPGNDAWFKDNQKYDGDSSWDGNRVRLPDGASQVSNSCEAPRRR